jgi:DNA-binding NarL/FixJ family response regulator
VGGRTRACYKRVTFFTKERSMLAPQNGHQSAHVLIIDGHDNERRFYARGLSDCSPQHTIVEAGDGRSGLNIFRSSRIDCVVLDLDLTDIPAFEVLGNLVTPLQKPEVAVVVLTNQRNYTLFERARREGAASCLVKSVTSGYLLSQAIQKAVYVVGARETRPS